MPYSYNFHDNDVVKFVNEELNPISILDMGPGAGKWASLLTLASNYHTRRVDAVEIHEPYVERFGLKKLYTRVFVGDACDFNKIVNISSYDLVVLGDIIEHLTVERAQQLLGELQEIDTLVLVPYKYEQGICEDNPHEVHLQPDLTEFLFHERYPGFIKLFGNQWQGVFFRAGEL